GDLLPDARRLRGQEDPRPRERRREPGAAAHRPRHWRRRSERRDRDSHAGGLSRRAALAVQDLLLGRVRHRRDRAPAHAHRHLWGALLPGGAADQGDRHPLRTLARSPGLSLAAVLTLGLGIGANTAMFGVVDRLFVRPPAHVVDPDRVVRIYVTTTTPPFGANTMPIGAYPRYADFRDH